MSEQLEAIGYDRVSTKRQADKGVMLEARAQSIPLYCQLKGWKLIKYLTDPGVSGREGKKRPGFDKAMELACRPGRVLVVDNFTRFIRSTVDADRALRRIRESGGQIAIVNCSIDTTTAFGTFLYKLIANLAELESNQIGDRVRAANAFSVAKHGYRRMGVQPAGWRIDESGERVRVEREWEVVAQCQRLLAELKSPAKVAKELTLAGTPTIARLRKKRGCGGWNGRKVRDLLASASRF